MATKKRKASKGEAKPKVSQETKDKKELLIRIRERFKVMSEADDENRREALADLKFVNVPGAQWDENMKKERGNRPCYEFNKLRINGKRVINEIRANRPQGKVRAVEGGDKKGAELREGLCRNIANMSDFETITDQQAEYQVDAGMGAWRVVTEYSDDTAFNQDILIKPIKNPFCLYADPASQDVLKRDAEDWILTERISNAAYEAKYGKAEKIDFDEAVRIVEYWYKEPYDKEIMLVETPTGKLTVDGSSDEAPGVKAAIAAGQYRLIKSRMAKCHRVMMCVASGQAILEGPVERPGTQFPFVIVYGEWKVVDGKVKWHGLHRFSKDAQRSYNVARTSIDETIAQAPQAKFFATPTQAKGHAEMWAEAHRKNFPFLLYNPDTQAPGAPQRMGGPEVPIALMQQTIVASQDIRETTGLHEASFGEESEEKSGIALARKQHQAQIVTYNFPDNMAKGVKRTWEIMLDYIPEIYDTERELRIIGADGAEDYETVNEMVPAVDAEGMPTTTRVNDMASGKYDVTVTVGPSFSTMRQEAAEVYGELGAKNPALMQVAGDLVFKSLDYPYADEIAKRWQTILPPPIQKMLSEGKELPPEAQAAMAQAEQAMAMVQQQTQLIQQAAQEVQTDKAASDVAKANVEKAIANLKTEEARFEAKVAKAMAALQKAESDVALGQVTIQGKETELKGREAQVEAQVKQNERGGVKEVKETLQQIDGFVAQFMEAQGQATQQIAAAVNQPKRKLKSMKTNRNGGKLTAQAEYDDGSVEAVEASRDEGGNLVAVPMNTVQ
jgi:hypothetical protein